MKNSRIRKMIAAVMAAFVAFAIVIVPQTFDSNAEAVIVSSTIKFSNGKTYNIIPDVYDLNMTKQLKGATKVKITSSKKSVAVVSGEWSVEEPDAHFLLITKKKGTATIKFKVTKSSGTKTYKMKLKVAKFQNPFKSLKVGSKNVKKAFKSEPLDYKNVGTGSKKVKAVMAKNWKLKKITYIRTSYATGKATKKTIKNNGKVKISGNDDLYERIIFKCYNTKTKATGEFTLIVGSDL